MWQAENLIYDASVCVRATQGSCVSVRPHAVHPLPCWRWDFLHLFLLPAKLRAHLLVLESKMAVTPINIVTAHTQVQWHVHTGTHIHRDTGLYVASLCSCHMPLPNKRPHIFAWWTHSSDLSPLKNAIIWSYCKIFTASNRKGTGWEKHVNGIVCDVSQSLGLFCYSALLWLLIHSL